MYKPVIRASLVAVFFASIAVAAENPADVQHLLRDRDQEQMQLRLRMQQQQDRALRPAPGASADFQMRQIERDQLQRQQQSIEGESRTDSPRGLPGQGAGERALRNTDSARSAREASEQEHRFERERRSETGRLKGDNPRKP